MRKSLVRAVVTLVLLGAAVHAFALQNALEQKAQIEARQAYERGQALMRSESFEAAIPHFQTAIRLDPMFWMAHYELGQAHMALKRYPQAVTAYLGCRQAFERAALLSVEDQGTMEKLREDELREIKDSLHRLRAGQLKVDQGTALRLELQMEDRIRFLESSRQRGNEQRSGTPAELLLALGSAYFRSGQLPEAEQAYTEAVKADGKLGAAHNNLAVIYMLSGRFAEANQSVKRAEKAGFPVSSAFKADLEKRAKSATPAP
jgi:tetratricopeptide (TPR) repeat protein